MAHLLSLLALMSLAVFVAAEAKALKYREISLPPGAIEMEVAIRQKGDAGSSPVATMKLEINGDERKIILYDAADQMPPGKVVEVTRDEDFVPEVESRYGIRAKRVCPLGYVRRGGVCFPDD